MSVIYSRQDQPIVARLIEALTARGVTVGSNEHGPSDGWGVLLTELSAAPAAVVVVWSAASATSPYVLEEAIKARRDGNLIPVSLNGIQVVPDSFRSLQTIDLSEWVGHPHDKSLDRVLDVLATRKAQARPPVGPEPTRPTPPMTRLPIRPAAREILRLALAIADAGGVRDAGPLDVLVACLLQDEYTELDRAELAAGATAAVVRILPQPADKQIAAALRTAGVDRSKIDLSGRSIDDPRLSRVASRADQLARQVGATELWSHHVVAAALDRPLSAAVLSALGVGAHQLRTALRTGIDLRWPNESRQAWDRILGVVPSLPVSPIYLDRVFRIDSPGSPRSSLAFLIDESTAVALSDRVPSFGSLVLERLGTRTPNQVRAAVLAVEQSGRIALLKPDEPFESRSGSFQLEPIVIPELNTRLETIGVDAAGNPFMLSCVAGGTIGRDLVMYTSRALAPGALLAGAPVITKDRVVGVVSGSSADQIFVVPSVEIRLTLETRAPGSSIPEPAVQVKSSGESEAPAGPELAEPAWAFAASAVALLAAAGYVHGDRPGPIDSVDLLLGGLGDALNGNAAAESTALWLAMPDTPPRSARIQEALTATGSQATFPGTFSAATDTGPSGPASLIGRTRALIARLGGGRIEVRHLLAAALDGTTSIPPAVEAALGVSAADLRQALRDAIRQTASDSDELDSAWDELLGTDEPTLVSSIDSDLVVWDDNRQLTDHLDIENYVTMLSLVVAAADTPMPLSIGLFGPWGSGKTYFMGLMRQAIKRLAEQAEQDRAAGRTPVSCARIVPITFNAWHYADANLWASLAVRIFDELAGRERQERTDLEKKRQGLIEKLRIYRELQAELDQESTRAQQHAKQLEERLARARERKKGAEGRLNGLNVSDVLAAAKDDPRLQQIWSRTSQELGSDEFKQLGISADLDRLTETAADLNAAAKDAVTLRTAAKDRRALTLTAAVLAVIGVVLLVAPGVLRAVGGTSIVAALAVAGRITTWLQQRAADIRLALNHVEATISVAEEARSRATAKYRVEVEQAEHEVEKANAEIADLEERRATAAETASEVDRQLAELQAGARLQRFIAERSASSDYQRQLGVVSQARRDFEDLTTALRDAIDEYQPGTGGPPVVDRIVLYIDDLDRCSAERVVEVLEAVHLLLAMDLFVVVVGVDPRWLLRSLRQRFQGVLSSSSEPDHDGGFWHWTPQNYLEKIFQIPFVLPSMSPTGYQELLKSLAIPDRHARRPSRLVALPDAAIPDEEVPAAAQPGSSPATDPAALPLEVGSQAATMSSDAQLAAATAAAPRTPQSLDLTEAELALLGELAPLVRTPRVAKRMLNIYRMLRVTRDLGPASRFLAGDYQAVCQLLALLTGYPRIFAHVVWGEHASDGQYHGLLDRPQQDRWSDFVDGLAPQPSSEGTWTNAVARAIPPAEGDDWQAVVVALVAVRRSLTLADALQPYQRWAPRIARFSFELSPFAGGGGHART